MQEVFGIREVSIGNVALRFEAIGEQRPFADLPWPDEITSGFHDGTCCPMLSLNHAARVETEADAQTIAAFVEGPTPAPTVGHPAMTIKSFGKGHAVYVAGIPSHEGIREEFGGMKVLNFAGRVISEIIMQLAGDKAPLRVLPRPPETAMQKIRPLDVWCRRRSSCRAQGRSYTLRLSRRTSRSRCDSRSRPTFTERNVGKPGSWSRTSGCRSLSKRTILSE